MKDDFICIHCGVDTFRIRELHYMVHHSIWAVARSLNRYPVSCFLCIGCVEQLVGFQLNKNHFLDVIINIEDGPSQHSARLANRLTGFNKLYGDVSIQASEKILLEQHRLTQSQADGYLLAYRKALARSKGTV